jgi:hypothetical protein
MSVTTFAAALMMFYAGAAEPLPVLAYESALVTELPEWLRGAQGVPTQWSPSPMPPRPIMPSNTCPIPGTERTASGRCLPDCRLGACKRIRVAESQTIYRNERGQTTGSATPDGSGGFVYRDAQGRTTGGSSSDSGGNTRFWDSSGKNENATESADIP